MKWAVSTQTFQITKKKKLETILVRILSSLSNSMKWAVSAQTFQIMKKKKMKKSNSDDKDIIENAKNNLLSY